DRRLGRATLKSHTTALDIRFLAPTDHMQKPMLDVELDAASLNPSRRVSENWHWLAFRISGNSRAPQPVAYPLPAS
ncbi:MAG: hypothetical protein WAN65_28010, partial [Candidatus Sulfotelmatobacter sp.]